MKPNPQETADLIIFTEEILNGKHHFLQRWPPFFFLSTNSIFAIMFITVYIIGLVNICNICSIICLGANPTSSPSLSSYGEKMRWGQGWVLIVKMHPHLGCMQQLKKYLPKVLETFKEIFFYNVNNFWKNLNISRIKTPLLTARHFCFQIVYRNGFQPKTSACDNKNIVPGVSFKKQTFR